MPSKHSTGTRSEVVRCPNCGEDYSVTYKRCPFCDERNLPPEDDYIRGEDDTDEGEDFVPRRGGKRVAGVRRGGGYGGGGGPLRIFVTIVSLAIIVAAVWIVFTQIVPLVSNGKPAEVTPPPAITPTATLPVEPTDTLPPATDDPNAVIPPVTSGDPAATPSPAPTPSGVIADSFTLNREDFTLRKGDPAFTLKATPAVSGLTWASDQPAAATVDQTGKVTWVGNGTANITATLPNGARRTCIVRCTGGDTAAAATPSPSATPAGGASAGTLKLNREDFTLGSAGEKFQIKVTGASGTPVWSISGGGEATISGNGTVTAVRKGEVTVTCKVDGQTLTCIVRCNF